MMQTTTSSNSRIQLSLNGSYDVKSTASSKTIRLVNRIRRLSPANWRRRSHSTTSRNQSYTSLIEVNNNSCSSTSSSESTGRPVSSITSTLPTTERQSRPLISNRKTIKRYHSSTSIGDFKMSMNSNQRLTKNHYSLRELYDLVEPDLNVWDLKRRFPTTFINLISSYMRSIELSSVEMANLRLHITTTNDDSFIQTLFNNSKQKPMKSRSKSSVMQIKNILTWSRIVNILINHLIKDKKYAVKFILRKPGNQIAINELEQTLIRLIESHQNPNTLPDVESLLLNSQDAHVISCVMTRLLRKNGPLFSDPIAKYFMQISSSQNVKKSDKIIREQRKSLRMLLLLHSEIMRDEVLRPLCHLLKAIASEPVCQVDSRSLSVLFSPIFFVNQNSTRPCDIQNPDFLRSLELLMEILMTNNVESIFQVPKLFTLDASQNLAISIEAMQRNDKELPPLQCSLRYCMPISPSPNKSQTKKIQRNNAFKSTTSPISSKLLMTEGPSQLEQGLGRSEKKRSLEEEPILFRESLLAPMMKKPIIMIHSQPSQNQRTTIIKSGHGDEINPFAPLIRNTLLDTQLNFRIRRRPSQQNKVKNNHHLSADESGHLSEAFCKNSVDGQTDTSSASLSGLLFECLRGNKENHLQIPM